MLLRDLFTPTTAFKSSQKQEIGKERKEEKKDNTRKYLLIMMIVLAKY